MTHAYMYCTDRRSYNHIELSRIMWLTFSPCCNKHLNVYLPSWENTKSYCKCRFCHCVTHTHVNDNVNVEI